MKLLLKNVNACLANEGFQNVDIEIIDGVYTQIGKIEISDHNRVIEKENLHCAPGFFDPFVNFGEPGFEHKEGLVSGCKAAAYGCFTQVAQMPDTNPVIDNRPQVDFINSQSKSLPVLVGAMPSFTKAQSVNELSEIGELADAGVIAFSQLSNKVVKPSVLLKALEYAKAFNKKLVVHATDFELVPGAFIHEGITNVKIGMRGIPDFTEELLVKKYVELLRYSGSSLHISGISSQKSLAIIEMAKSEGLNLTADTSVYNLIFTEDNLLDFDTNFKLNPPLRSVNDKDALIDAVKSGVIDVVTSNHQPHEDDAKKLELETSEFGVIGVQTVFPALADTIGLSNAINILANRNRKTFDLDIPTIKVGNRANLSLFNPKSSWVFKVSNNLSKSQNSMFINHEFMTKPLGIVNGLSLVINV
ncbi:MAG: dihydroorotase [Bacteroidia bacterium]